MSNYDPQLALRQTIAGVLDHPSVYMGGPSRQHLRKADQIIECLRRDPRLMEALRAGMETLPARMQDLNERFAGRERICDQGELTPRMSEQETSPVQAVCDRAAHLADVPTVPKGHFWRGVPESNRHQCRNCGEHYDKHLHTDEASTCPTANR
jgi:hypothetical protein